jgi:hypothetical protein
MVYFLLDIYFSRFRLHGPIKCMHTTTTYAPLFKIAGYSIYIATFFSQEL